MSCFGASFAVPNHYFGIQVVDEDTGRGVPMVELKTTSNVAYYTDSAGWVAFFEPGLMNRKVYFGITSHGYEFPKDGFGSVGRVLETKPGTQVTLKIKRVNIAERLYRITGQGIYRDSILLGKKVPIAQPLLDAEVTGQDGILTAIYQGNVYWLYGDTSRLSYPLGNFHMTGATTPPPAKIDPDIGFNLAYFTNRDGFAREMAPMKGEGVVWLACLVVVPDETGRERMAAFFHRRRGLGEVLEAGFVLWNDTTRQFDKLKELPLKQESHFIGYPFRAHGTNDAGFVYFTAGYPVARFRADLKSFLDPASHEAYTCLRPGTHYARKENPELERDADGKLVWGWKRDTSPLFPADQQRLIKAGLMKRDESPFRLEDAETGKPILLGNCSCFWNDYRQRYVMIAAESMGATMLGEIWYSEADRPEGPWIKARKIITHANKAHDAHDFYNPTQHPFLDREGGRVIYLEGSYVNTFSGNPHATPYYDYNQIMYRLDLSDPRLAGLGGAPVSEQAR